MAILQTEILSTETSDFLKQKIILISFNSVLHVVYTCPISKNLYEINLLVGGDTSALTKVQTVYVSPISNIIPQRRHFKQASTRLS